MSKKTSNKKEIDKKKLIFHVNDDPPDRAEEYYFILDENNKPIKLGDGTYGVVFKVYNSTKNEEFAVKLLYENELTSPRLISELNEQALREIIKLSTSELRIKKDNEKITKIFLSNLNDPEQLIVDLSKSKIRKWKELVNGVRKKANSTAVERFNREAEVTRILRKNKGLRGEQSGDIAGTVEIEGKTKKFKSYPAYKFLSPILKKTGYDISDYALVMDLYQFSLKDLLEKGPNKKKYAVKRSVLIDVFKSINSVPKILIEIYDSKEELIKQLEEIRERTDLIITDEQLKLLNEGIVEAVGYELLKLMSFEERISTALPYLHYVSTGLKHLHDVLPPDGPLFHLDIKPANIFVRKSAAHGIECALGDLGYLKIKQNYQHSRVQNIDELPLGTLHYRSPEQKEYFDIANVEISISTNEKIVLKVKDPKFNGSFIEENDIVRFSKDKTRYPYLIEKITKNSSGSIEVQIDKPTSQIAEDEQTQVIFIKNHEYRTDLFGIGAIAFDLITCGLSPERFYESIRRFEFNDDGKEIGDVKDTIEKYRRVVNGQAQADEPSLLKIFEPFKHQTQPNYAPEEIVNLILRCMFYKAENSFYSETNALSQPLSEAISNIINIIDKLKGDYNPKYSENALLTLKLKKEEKEGADQLGKLIDNLQESIPQNWQLRLAQGVFYFEKLALLVWESLSTGKDTGVHLYQMLPSIIQWNSNGKKFKYLYPTYSEKKDFYEDMINGNMAKILKDSSNPYVPYQMAFLKRSLKIKKEKNKQGDTEGSLRFTYRFKDKSPFGSRVNKGDWIVLKDFKSIGRIISIEKKQILFKLIPIKRENKEADLRDVILNDNHNEGNLDALLFKDLNPCVYYLEMLAIYLHNIFFAYSPHLLNCNLDNVDIFSLLREKANCNRLYNINEIKQVGIKKIKKSIINSFVKKDQEIFSQEGLTHIYAYLSWMYLKLVFHTSDDSYFSKVKDDDYKEIIQEVKNEAEFLRKKIEYLFNAQNKFKDEVPTIKLINKLTLDKNIIIDHDLLLQSPLNINSIMKGLLIK